jgi:hypothetical protein
MQYSIYIQYSNFGFSIEYGGVTETTQDINVCTGSLEDTNLQLISLYLGTQIQGIDLNPSYQSNELKNIVDVTDTNIDMLYREVEERGEPFCLITPIDIWN